MIAAAFFWTPSYCCQCRDKMESLYLCLTCTRALTTGTRTASGKRLGRILTSSRRSFASSARKQLHTIKSQHAPLRPRQTAVKAAVKVPVRLASTAAARMEEEDNFERHNI